MHSPLAYIHPEAHIGQNVEIAPFAYIEKGVTIGDGCVIMPHASILEGTTLGPDNKVYSNTVIGSIPQDFHYQPGAPRRVIIGARNEIRENVVIAGGIHGTEGATIIGDDNHLMDKVHICHDTRIGSHCVLGIGVSVAGDCIIDDCSIQSSFVVLQQHVRVGRYSLVQSGCRVQKDVPPYIVLGGNPAGYHGINSMVLNHVGMDQRIMRHIANTYRLVYTGNFSLEDAILKIPEQIPMSEEIEKILQFLKTTKHGIVRPKMS